MKFLNTVYGLMISDYNHIWIKNGRNHRTKGPAVIWPDGYRLWYKNNKRHRLDGPATIYSDGSFSWWKNGRRVSAF